LILQHVQTELSAQTARIVLDLIAVFVTGSVTAPATAQWSETDNVIARLVGLVPRARFVLEQSHKIGKLTVLIVPQNITDQLASFIAPVIAAIVQKDSMVQVTVFAVLSLMKFFAPTGPMDLATAVVGPVYVLLLVIMVIFVSILV